MRVLRLAAIAMAAFALAGCASSDPTVTGSIASPVAKTIAFESVDGPPKPIFDRLVAVLSSEAEKRELPVVSHTGPAAYRVRAYLATFVEKKKKQATLSWAWEVYDVGQNRSFRLTGEEPLGAPKADVWAQCDDVLLQRIAGKGFEALSARLGPLPASPSPAPAPGEPQPGGPLVASVDRPGAVAFAETRN
jgi:hypothetical protein